MQDEIASLAEQIPRFLRDMLEPPDLDGDGRADWAAVEDAGFLRDDSLLVLLFITDEEDESACTGAPGDECIEHCVTIAGRTLCRAPVGSVDQYVEGMRRLRDDPTQLVVGSLAGAPVETLDPEEILRATLESNPFRAICRNGALSGLPAPRMVDFTQQLEGLFLSICSEGYEALVAPIAARVGRLACDE